MRDLKSIRVGYTVSDAVLDTGVRNCLESIGFTDLEKERFFDFDILVVVGGDGFMLRCLHRWLPTRDVISVYGINFGTLGFLLNEYSPSLLENSISSAVDVTVFPIQVDLSTDLGDFSSLAINDVSIFRATHHAVTLNVEINSQEVMKKLIADGILVSTPIGSTAYNLSARGPVIPIESGLLSVMPLNPFRPRAWNGALLKDDTKILIEVQNHTKRKARASADYKEYQNIKNAYIKLIKHKKIKLLFDVNETIQDKILAQQFLHKERE